MKALGWLCLLLAVCSVRAEQERAWRQQSSYELPPAGGGPQAQVSMMAPPLASASSLPPASAAMNAPVSATQNAPPQLGKELPNPFVNMFPSNPLAMPSSQPPVLAETHATVQSELQMLASIGSRRSSPQSSSQRERRHPHRHHRRHRHHRPHRRHSSSSEFRFRSTDKAWEWARQHMTAEQIKAWQTWYTTHMHDKHWSPKSYYEHYYAHPRFEQKFYAPHPESAAAAPQQQQQQQQQQAKTAEKPAALLEIKEQHESEPVVTLHRRQLSYGDPINSARFIELSSTTGADAKANSRYNVGGGGGQGGFPMGYGPPTAPGTLNAIPVLPGNMLGSPAVQANSFGIMASTNSMNDPNGPVANMLTNPGPPGLAGRSFGSGGSDGTWQTRGSYNSQFPSFRSMSMQTPPADPSAAGAGVVGGDPSVANQINPQGSPMPFYAPTAVPPPAPNQVPSTTYMQNNAFATTLPSTLDPNAGTSGANMNANTGGASQRFRQYPFGI